MIHPDPGVQRAQTAHRRRIAESWPIAPDSNILEIGCGQGDMTAVLAEKGRVLAVDSAGPEYGAPFTLGEATARLKASPVGGNIEFRLGLNVLDPAVDFPADTFDAVAMAHSSWYFNSKEELNRLLVKIRPWTRSFCFAEWDLVPQSRSQVAHMLAVLIQGQVEAFKSDSKANVRTPFTQQTFRALLAQTGWQVISESELDTTSLQDANWEIAACLSSSLDDARRLGIPTSFIETQIELLETVAVRSGNAPLPCYSIVAERD